MIRRARAEELQSLAAFIAGLQRDPGSRIAYFGESREEIAAEIEEWGSSWPDQSLVAERDGLVIGFAGTDLDRVLGRAWLHGPLVAREEWDSLADRLLTQLVADVVPAAVRDHELAGDAANERLGELAERRGFVRGVPNFALEIDRAQVAGLSTLDVPPLMPPGHEAFVALHDALFPRTYYSGRQLVEQHTRGTATVLALADHRELLGYAVGRVDAGAEGYLDFVGVADHARRAGHGRRLVIAICRALLADDRPSRVSLTVREDNRAALALYEQLGFRHAAYLVGYRRRPVVAEETT